MGIFTDWVQARSNNRYALRLAQHFDTAAEDGYMLQNGRRTTGENVNPLEVAKAAIVDGALGTLIGLPGDLGALAGEDLAGGYIGQVVNHSDNPANAAIATAYATQGPGGALAAAKVDPRKEVSLPAGGLGFLLDPTLLVGGLAGGASKAGKVGKLARVADVIFNKPAEAIGEGALGIGRAALDPAAAIIKKYAQKAATTAATEAAPAIAKVAPAADLLATPAADLLTTPAAEVPASAAVQAVIDSADRRAAAGVVKGQPAKWTPEQQAILANDPEVQRLQGTIDAIKGSAKGAGILDNNGMLGVASDRQKSLKGLGFQLSAARKQALTTAAEAATATPAATIAQIAPADLLDDAGPSASRGLGDRLRALQTAYGPQWRNRLGNLTGGDYLAGRRWLPPRPCR